MIADSIKMHAASAMHYEQLEQYAAEHGLVNQNREIRSEGNCGPNSTTLLLGDLRREQWTESERASRSLASRAANADLLETLWDVDVPGRPYTFRTLLDPSADLEQHINRMRGDREWYETPQIAAEAILRDRPIHVIVSQAGAQPNVQEYYPASEEGLLREPMIVGMVNTRTGAHYMPFTRTASPFVDEMNQQPENELELSSAPQTQNVCELPCPPLATPGPDTRSAR